MGQIQRDSPPTAAVAIPVRSITWDASQPWPDEVLSGIAVEDAILELAIKKANAPFDKSFFLGALAGVWVGFGGIAAFSIAGGIPVEVRNEWPMLPKLSTGIFFTFALHFIVMFGGDLFTGSMMTLTIGVLNGVVPLYKLALNWLAVYLGNWAGCLFAAYFFALRTELFDNEPYHSYVQSFTLGKITGHTWGTLFLKAIPANTLVGMAVVLAVTCRDSAGRIMALHFPVLLFVISGYEHCVANMFFISTGLMYGAPSTIGRFWYNQSAAIVGNFVGGAIIIAGGLHAMNHWVTIMPRGILAGGDNDGSAPTNVYAMRQFDDGAYMQEGKRKMEIEDMEMKSGRSSGMKVEVEVREVESVESDGSDDGFVKKESGDGRLSHAVVEIVPGEEEDIASHSFHAR